MFKGRSWGGRPSDPWSPGREAEAATRELICFSQQGQNEYKMQDAVPHVTRCPLQSRVTLCLKPRNPWNPESKQQGRKTLLPLPPFSSEPVLPLTVFHRLEISNAKGKVKFEVDWLDKCQGPFQLSQSSSLGLDNAGLPASTLPVCLCSVPRGWVRGGRDTQFWKMMVSEVPSQPSPNTRYRCFYLIKRIWRNNFLTMNVPFMSGGQIREGTLSQLSWNACFTSKAIGQIIDHKLG